MAGSGRLTCRCGCERAWAEPERVAPWCVRNCSGAGQGLVLMVSVSVKLGVV